MKQQFEWFRREKSVGAAALHSVALNKVCLTGEYCERETRWSLSDFAEDVLDYEELHGWQEDVEEQQLGPTGDCGQRAEAGVVTRRALHVIDDAERYLKTYAAAAAAALTPFERETAWP